MYKYGRRAFKKINRKLPKGVFKYKHYGRSDAETDIMHTSNLKTPRLVHKKLLESSFGDVTIK